MSLGDLDHRFAHAARHFAESIADNFSLLVPGQPEDQLKSPVQALLVEAGASMGFGVQCRTESTLADLTGRPDIAVAVDKLLAGYVELKAPGKGAQPERYRGTDRKQWLRFMSLPNVIYTDGAEWSLYHAGQLIDRVRIAADIRVRDRHPDSDALARLARLFRVFLSWAPIPPTSAKDLANTLAPLCRLVREDALGALGNPSSALSQLARDWRQLLFPDADDPQFADAYAQTLTYALLLARLSGATDLSTTAAASSLASGHGLLAEVLKVLADPDARREIRTGADLLERTLASVTLADLAGATSDPWLYFYEDFLAAYDPALRKDRGVYYTPPEVVSAQVALTSELLRDGFGKPLGFAEEGVVVLDPAAGTGTYPVAIVQSSLRGVEKEFGPGAIPQRAEVLAENVNAFELLVGPYAVAHFRLSQLFLSVGARLPASGVHVYLTDTLEPPGDSPAGQLHWFTKRLADEHRHAQRVKSETRVVVCIGNPPYDRQQIDRSDPATERKGGWVRYGDHGQRGILDDFIAPVTRAAGGLHVKNLFNDYVYFWRWALWKVLETNDGPGIVSFITAASYLRGPGFAGMREVFRREFDELWMIDLEGGNRGPRRTENVFAIQTPVAIAVGVRYGPPDPDHAAILHYARLTGSRIDKLAALKAVTSRDDLDWLPGMAGWQQPFLPDRTGDFWSWPTLGELFPWQHSGVQAKRTWPIAESRQVLEERWERLIGAEPAVKRILFRETDRVIDRSYPSLAGVKQRALVQEPPGTPPPAIVPYAYRAFDRQWLLLDTRVIDRVRPPLWAVRGDRQLYLTSLTSTTLGEGPAILATTDVPDLHHFRGSFGAKDVAPLYRDAEGRDPNITAGLLQTLSERLGEPIGPETFVSYCYGLLGASAYGESFSEELVESGPRIPVTSNPSLFREVARLGAELIWVQTSGERRYDKSLPPRLPQGTARALVPVPTSRSEYPDSFEYDPGQQILAVGSGIFGPVSPEVWEYQVSGLIVVRSWLAERMHHGAGRKSSELDDVRPRAWSHEFTEQLLRMIWTIESTLRVAGKVEDVLRRVVSSDLLLATDLPAPMEWEKLAPVPDNPEDEQNLPLGLF